MSEKARSTRRLHRHEAKAARRRRRKAQAVTAAAIAGAAFAATGGSAGAWDTGGGGTGTAPADGLIAFDSIRDTNTRDIWTIDPDATAPPATATPQTQYPLSDRNAQFSPNGLRLAFVSQRPESQDVQPQVYVQDVGSPASAQKVTQTVDNNGGPLNVLQPSTFRGGLAWSPDGTKIAFSKSNTRVESDIYVVDVASGTETQITAAPGVDANPTWSPNGNYISFESNRAGSDGYDIWRVDATGGPEANPVDLAPYAGDQVEPDYSPGGYLLLYASNQDAQAQQDIYVKPASTNTTSWQLTTTAEDEEVPRWSPTGTRFTYASQRGGDASYDIFVQNLLPDTNANANVRNVTQAPAVPDRRPDWQFVPGSSGGGGCRSQNEQAKESGLTTQALATGTSPLDGIMNNQQPSSQYGSSYNASSDASGGVSSDCVGTASSDGTGSGNGGASD
jgi:Tol biopolymer transport system component